MEVLESRSLGADDHDLAICLSCGELVGVHPPVGDRGHGARRSGEVDRHPVLGAAEELGADFVAGGVRGNRHAERVDPLVGVLHVAQLPFGVSDHRRVGGARADLSEHGIATEYVGLATRCNGVSREHHVVGARDRLDQGVVIDDVGWLGELDVEGNQSGACGEQMIDHEGVVAPRERPLVADARVLRVKRAEVVERPLVDVDNNQVLDERWPRPADGKASIDRLGLERVEQAGRVGENSQPDGRNRHGRQEQPLPSQPGASPHCRRDASGTNRSPRATWSPRCDNGRVVRCE